MIIFIAVTTTSLSPDTADWAELRHALTLTRKILEGSNQPPAPEAPGRPAIKKKEVKPEGASAPGRDGDSSWD